MTNLQDIFSAVKKTQFYDCGNRKLSVKSSNTVEKENSYTHTVVLREVFLNFFVS